MKVHSELLGNLFQGSVYFWYITRLSEKKNQYNRDSGTGGTGGAIVPPNFDTFVRIHPYVAPPIL